MNPLNSIVLEEDQKVQQLCRFAKESFNKLFQLFEFKGFEIDDVQLKNRTDHFSSLRHKKYGGRRSSNDPKVLIVTMKNLNLLLEIIQNIIGEHQIQFSLS